jgi:gliding motility-associated lipoprotein GldD
MALHRQFLIIIFTALIFVSCQDTPVPKPRGYFKIHLPEKKYVIYDSPCPFTAEIPTYSKVEVISSGSMDSCWFNISFPRMRAKIHFTYLSLSDNLEKYMEDAYQFAFKHEMKANNIHRSAIHLPENDVNGLIYDLTGNVATSLQFFATDSSDHFLRGALYFSNRPNEDSIAPVQEFIREDVMHFLKTIEWAKADV